MRQTTLVPIAPRQRAPARRLCHVHELGEAGHVIPAGMEWARVACPTHGDVWCAIDRADARRRRAPCPRCERHEPADPPEAAGAWVLTGPKTWTFYPGDGPMPGAP